MKLGGWQRLWIVLSVIWLLPVALVTFSLMQDKTEPQRSQYEQQRLRATTDLIEKEASLKVKVADGTTIVNVPNRISKEDLEKLHAKYLKRDQTPSAPRRKHLLDIQLDFDLLVRSDGGQGGAIWRHAMPVESRVAAAETRQLQNDYAKWIDFSEVDSTAKDSLRQLRWEQAKIGMYGFLFWLASIGLAYLFGAAVGWVVRGFRGKQSHGE